MNETRPALRTLAYNPKPECFRFHINPQAIFTNFASVSTWREFEDNGSINIPGVLGYVTSNIHLMDMVKNEFQMYNWHYYPEGGAKSRRGWLRNMNYSLIQQLVRMDPLVYALTVAARPDKNWRLISVPYYVKDTQEGESTGFRHLNLNMENYIQHGWGSQAIQGSISLDDETDNGCTLIVKGFHKHICQWWQYVKERVGEENVPSGENTNFTRLLYNNIDKERYGDFEPVPCEKGSLRLTRADIPHGSTPLAPQQRRCIFPWYTALDKDYRRVDFPKTESWDAISCYHRDFKIPKDISLPVAITLEPPWQIGAALVGKAKWESSKIRMELKVLFGDDLQAAQQLVGGVRTRLVTAYKDAYMELEKLERIMFGQKSFFRHLESGEDQPPPDGTQVDFSDLPDFSDLSEFEE